jgi:hypothetical protein
MSIKHASHHRPAWRPLAICPKNKPFLAETLKAENSGGAAKA